MRCFFFRGCRIQSVEFLGKGSDDDLIRQAHDLFAKRNDPKLDGFEVWDQNRFVYRWPWDEARERKERSQH